MPERLAASVPVGRRRRLNGSAGVGGRLDGLHLGRRHDRRRRGRGHHDRRRNRQALHRGPQRVRERLHLRLDRQQHLRRVLLVPRVGVGRELELTKRLIELLARVVDALLREEVGHFSAQEAQRRALLLRQPTQRLRSFHQRDADVEIAFEIGRHPRLRQQLDDGEQGAIELVSILIPLTDHRERRVAVQIERRIRLGQERVAGLERLRADGEHLPARDDELTADELEAPRPRVEHRGAVEASRRRRHDDGEDQQVAKRPPQPGEERGSLSGVVVGGHGAQQASTG